MSFRSVRSVGSGAGVLFFFLPLLSPAAASREEWADRDRFPEAYSILTSERIMFPDLEADLPLSIGPERQLFVDDYLISSLENLEREYHSPVKFPGNPLLSGGHFAVLRDPQTGRFRMWKSDAYLESEDGIRWKRPEGAPEEGRLFDPPGQLRGLIQEPKDGLRSKRFLAVLERRPRKKTDDPSGFYLYESPDGVHWKPSFRRAILLRTINPMNPGPFWAKGRGDTSTFRYDPVLGRYIWDGKFNLYLPREKIEQLRIVPDHKPRLRLRTFSESEDLIHWTPPRLYLFPDRNDRRDCQIYGHVGFVYESMWLGLARILHLIPTGWKQVDIQLTFSRDGRHWSRPRRRRPFIPLGGAESWDPDYSGPAFTPPVLVGDELWFYYFGSRNPKRDGKPVTGPWPLKIGLARLRRDGFASLNAGRSPGRVVTRPLTYRGGALFVNVKVERGGRIRAAVLTAEGDPVPGYALEDCVPFSGDTTSGRLKWRTHDRLPGPGRRHFRLLFELLNAKLYSFRVE